MRRAGSAGLAVTALALALAGPGRAEDAPFNPFENAAVGDWFVTKTTIAEGERKQTMLQLAEVSSVQGDDVYVKSPGERDAKIYSKKKALTIAEILGAAPSTKLLDVKVTDEKKTVSGKTFDCKLVTFKVAGGDPVEAKLWLSPEVKVMGWVTVQVRRTPKNGPEVVTTLEIAAYGTKDKTLFGTDRATLEKTINPPDETPQAPFNPFEKAEAGDWVAQKATVALSEPKVVQYGIIEVVKVEGDKVSLKSQGQVQTYSKTKAPLLSEILDQPATAKVSGVKATDDKRTVGGKELACKLITFSVIYKAGGNRLEGRAWLNPDVKVNGLVAFELKKPDEKQVPIALEIVGYGTKDKTLWGMTRAEADKKVAESQQGAK